MNSKTTVPLAIICLAGLVVTLVVFFGGNGQRGSLQYEITENFVYGESRVSISAQNGKTEVQRELQAEKAARVNSLFAIMKAVYKENIATSFVEIYSVKEVDGKLRIDGEVKYEKIIRKEIVDGKAIVKLRVPIETEG